MPTKPAPSVANLEALRVGGEKMQELAAAGTNEEKIMADFRNLRRKRPMQKTVEVETYEPFGISGPPTNRLPRLRWA